MKTNDLIRLLASDHAAPRSDLSGRLAVGALAGAGLSLSALLFVLGARPDIDALASNWRLTVKFAVALSFAVTGAVLSLRLARPFAANGYIWLMLLPAPLILAGACAFELMVTPPEEWARRVMGANALACLLSIPLFSALPLAGIVWALREGAPASTEQAGIAAGAMAAGIGAAVYALHCRDDSPLFLALWYVAATTVVVIAGRFSGSRLLRW